MENKSTKWNYSLVLALGVLGCRKTLDITKLALDTRKSFVKVAIIIILTVGDNSYENPGICLFSPVAHLGLLRRSLRPSIQCIKIPKECLKYPRAML